MFWDPMRNSPNNEPKSDVPTNTVLQSPLYLYNKTHTHIISSNAMSTLNAPTSLSCPVVSSHTYLTDEEKKFKKQIFVLLLNSSFCNFRPRKLHGWHVENITAEIWLKFKGMTKKFDQQQKGRTTHQQLVKHATNRQWCTPAFNAPNPEPPNSKTQHKNQWTIA